MPDQTKTDLDLQLLQRCIKREVSLISETANYRTVSFKTWKDSC